MAYDIPDGAEHYLDIGAYELYIKDNRLYIHSTEYHPEVLMIPQGNLEQILDIMEEIKPSES